MEFYDQFEHNIDDKGRLVLPAAYRAAFASGGYATIRAGYVGLYPQGEWERERRRMAESGRFTQRDLQRILALTSPFTPDAQYRINLGTKLREAVEPNLGREVTVVGSGTHAGVYDRAAWSAIESGVDDAPLVDKIASLEWL